MLSRLLAAIAVLLAGLAGLRAGAGTPPPLLYLADPGEWRIALHGPASLRAAAEAGDDALLVVTGGALRSAGAPAGREAGFAVAMLDAAGVAVVNLAHRDLSGNPAALVAALEAGRPAFISASFRMAGQPWQPHVMVEHGGRKIAFIGVASLSPSMALPEAGALPGLEFVAPVDAVRGALGAISDADDIIVLADLPLAGALELREEFTDLAAVVNSSRGGFHLAEATFDGLLLSPPGGRRMAVWEHGKDARVIRLEEPDRINPGAADVLQRFEFSPQPPGQLAPTAPPVLAPTPGQAQILNLVRENRALRWTVHSATWLDEIGPAKAPDGLRWLVLDVEWENLLTPALVRDKELPVEYRIRRLDDHLYLVADSARLVPTANIPDVPNLIEPDHAIRLPGLGSTRRGMLAYALPSASMPGSLGFRYYDFAHGHFTADLLPVPDVSEPVADPARHAANEIVTAGVSEIRETRELRGQVAPEGMIFVELEFRARSMFTSLVKASAFEPLAGPDETIELGTVCDWLEAHRYAHLVVDGEFAFNPDPELSTLPANPRFLPDLMTGGTMVFLVPEAAASRVLRADFPNARMPDGQVIRPRPITLALRGEPQPPQAREAVWEVEDDTLRVAVTGWSIAPAFAGVSPPDPARRFLVLDVTVRNHGTRPEFFQTAEQLRQVDARDRRIAPHPATYQGRHRPAEHVWVPDGEQRSFQLAYLIDADQERPRIAYRGFTMAVNVELEAGGAIATAVDGADGADSLVRRVEPGTEEAAIPRSETDEPPAEAAAVIDPARSRERAMERLPLHPLEIAEPDFDAPAVAHVAGPSHTSMDEALVLAEPWTARGKLESRQQHYFKIEIDGPPQLWHIEVTGATLVLLDPGARAHLQRRPDSRTRKAGVTGLMLLPGPHWFAVSGGTDYTFRAVPLGPPDPNAEIEPNDDAATAQSLEPGVPMAGRIHDIGDRDFFRFSIAAEENLAFELQAPEEMTLRMEILEAYGGSLTRVLHGEGGNLIRHGARFAPGDYLISIQARPSNQRSSHPYVLEVRRLDPFDPDPDHTANESDGGEPQPLPLTMTLAGEDHSAPPAAFIREAQRMRLPLQIINHGAAAMDLRLDSHASLADAVITMADSVLSVPAGGTISTTVDLLLPPDLHAGKPCIITIRARDDDGAWSTMRQQWIPECSVPPLDPHMHQPLPEALLGGMNVAWTALGADVPVSEGERNQVLTILDGYTPVDGGFNRPARFPREFTVRLAGDGPVPVAGVTLFPQAGRSAPDHWTKSFDVLLSQDGESFDHVFSGELERRAVEQAFVFDAPVSARYARLRVNDNHGGTRGRTVLGQWKVIAPPGVHVPGMEPLNIASEDFGAHVVWKDPFPMARGELMGMLGEGGHATGFNLREARPVRWVIGFHQQRAARITELQWVDPPASWRYEPLSEVVVSVSMTSPLGPWSELGTWKLERDSEGVALFKLAEPCWARYVQFTSYDPDKPRTSWQKPQTLRILEQLPGEGYLSILAEWGHYARDAVYEHLEQAAPEPFVPLREDHATRDTAHPLTHETPYSGAVQIGVCEEWHRIDIPGEENRLTLRLTGHPDLRVQARLENVDGTAVAMQREDLSPRERVLRAEVTPGTRYLLRIHEPPRSMIFAWDNSGSMGPYKPAVNQGLRRFIEEVTPGIEYANFLPFQSDTPALLHPGWSDQTYELWATLSQYQGRDDSSNAEPNLLAATKALADRDGARAVLLLTDAETFGFGASTELWQAMAMSPPQIFTVELHTSRSQPYQQNLMQSWAQVNAGHYSLFHSQQDVDVAFRRASSMLRRPAQYTLVAMADREEPPTEEEEPAAARESDGQSVAEMMDELVEKGRVTAHGIFFDVNSHTIRSQSFPVLREIGNLLGSNPDLRIIIEGHTDSTGRASWNQVLSERRAESVRRFLIDNHGIEPGRLESTGYGQERPADTNETAEGRQNNRRVELVRIAP